LRPFLGCPICPDSPFSRVQPSRPPNGNKAVLTNAVEVGGGGDKCGNLRFFEVFRFRPRARGASV
jgi:hypothetical protein